jgi:hypothetical protein
MAKQVFLGGACGTTDWRRRIAIPLLEAAGITYCDPQLGEGDWTGEREAFEMENKAVADVLLYVVSNETRGVATVGEVAFALGSRHPVALSMTDIGPDDCLYGERPSCAEREDLNRGRMLIRSLAQQAGVPVFCDVEGAVRHAIALIEGQEGRLTMKKLRAVLADVAFRKTEFLIEPCMGGFLIQLQGKERDAVTQKPGTYVGRKWHVSERATRSEIVRTAFKAAVTWAEHETREDFRYRGVAVLGPHAEVDDLASLLAVRTGLQELAAEDDVQS